MHCHTSLVHLPEVSRITQWQELSDQCTAQPLLTEWKRKVHWCVHTVKLAARHLKEPPWEQQGQKKPRLPPAIFCFCCITCWAKGIFNGKIHLAHRHMECNCKGFQSPTTKSRLLETSSPPFWKQKRHITTECHFHWGKNPEMPRQLKISWLNCNYVNRYAKP